MAQTSFQLDDGASNLIDELKGVFGVSTSAAVVRRAIALAKVAAENRSKDSDSITLIDPDGGKLRVLLKG